MVFCSHIRMSTEVSKRLVILGTGWGSYSALRSADRNLFQIVVVSPRNHFLFTPLLCSTTVGTLEFRSVIEPVRNWGFRRADNFHLAHAEKVDFEQRKVLCRSVLNPTSTYEIDYDQLIVGVGALPGTYGVPGVQEYAFFLKEVSHANAVRERLLSNFELSLQPGLSKAEVDRLMHVVIVGGGPTGVEFGAELYDFCTSDVKHLYAGASAIKVSMIESHHILSQFDSRLQAYAEKKIRQRENYNMIKSSVTEVRPNAVVLEDGRVLPCSLVVWCTGLAPRRFTVSLGADLNEHGQILTDDHMRITSDKSGRSYSVGDCASIIDKPLPCTAQVAERQGRYVAKSLNEMARSGSSEGIPPFEFKSQGMLAYIGGYEALSDLPDFKLKGFTSWFLWRSAYLTRLGSWRLRLQVPLDWLKTLTFGRDTSRF